MNTKWLLIVLLTAVLAVGILAGGFIAGRLTAPQAFDYADDPFGWPRAFGGMIGGGGMMGGSGMMGGPGGGQVGMMGGTGWSGAAVGALLTVEQAAQAAEDYLQSLDYEALEIVEVMIFDNHAYVEVEDPALDMGAFELLVDPVTKAVFLEYGPSMMWNVEYGMMGSQSRGVVGGMMGGWRGGMGGMMGGSGAIAPGTFDPATLSVTAEEAGQIAGEYLGQYRPGQTVDGHAEIFPGYYTLHTLENGEIVGMLSVNGYTGQVWYHTWHGQLLEVSESPE